MKIILSFGLLVVLAAPAAAEPGLSAKRLYFRGGVVHVHPLSHSSALELSAVHGPASLAISDGPVAGSGAALDPITTGAVIVGYTLPVLGDRLAVETVLGAPLHARFRATGTLATMSLAPTALGAIPTGIPPLGPELGVADAAPPVVTLVARLAELGPVRPYAGAGVGVLVTYNAHTTNPILTEVAEPRFRIEPAAGLALQAGFDIRLWRRVTARVDIKYIAFMKAHATVEDIVVRTPAIPLFDKVAVGNAAMDMWLDPLIASAGIGADFQ